MLDKLTAAWRSLTPSQTKALYGLAAAIVAVLIAFGVLPSGDTPQPATTPAPVTASTGATSDAGQRDADPKQAAQVAAAADRIPTDPRPPAGAQNYSCPFKGVQNYSNRVSKAVQFVVHETVSRPGTLAAIWGLFNSPSFGASSHYLMEVWGKCQQIVPLAKKAWTQGAFNSASVSVELIAPSGSTRAWWMKQPIIKRGILAALIRDNLTRMGSPKRWVDPVGCTPRAGWTDHEHLECGNDHCDVTGCDAFPRDVVAAQVRLGVPAGSKQQRWCRTLNRLRKPIHAGTATKGQHARAKTVKALLKRDGYTCHPKASR